VLKSKHGIKDLVFIKAWNQGFSIFHFAHADLLVEKMSEKSLSVSFLFGFFHFVARKWS
jgi:hypothetical protein